MPTQNQRVVSEALSLARENFDRGLDHLWHKGWFDHPEKCRLWFIDKCGDHGIGVPIGDGMTATKYRKEV